ncbi:MAG: hypothetical protein ACLGIA_05985 [Actinomycetes bacterium]
MSSLDPPPLLARLVDDAAVFPPGLAPMRVAVAAHGEHRGAWYGEVIGPFLVPVLQLPSFEGALGEVADDREALQVSLVADRKAADPLPGLLAAVHRLGRRRDVDVAAVEVALSPGPAQPQRAQRLAAALDEDLPDGVQAWVEVNREDDVEQALAALAASPSQVRAKFRTGGTDAAAFPSAELLGRVLGAAVDLSLPLKLTAGLHSAMPGTDPATGFAHHGFLTVLAAVAAAQDGASQADVVAVLQARDASVVTGALEALEEDGCAAVRSVLRSFGCCGVRDPVDDLVRLGMLQVPAVEATAGIAGSRQGEEVA